ncbi:MAG: SprT family zinc-dependent metalloprotease [Candidatus Omnitrophica bacterium]|nr:SprT family zinc-dependent metalloprotease [Candidatus Omnitrophota bacterium]MDD5429734.1 SprT family zinc-dependent metalloprotease [Candidatus Omnitrophota bacterium]
MPELTYNLFRQPKRKTLSISVGQDCRITVKVPSRLSEQEINSFIRKKSSWILKKIAFNQKVRKPYTPKKFTEGENFLYLGRSCPLSIRTHPGSRMRVIFDGIHLNLFLPTSRIISSDSQVQKLTQWYKSRAVFCINRRVSFYSRMLKIFPESIKIKTLNRSWGNCSKKGVVSFNWKLIMAPLAIIDYVVVHELCHLTEHNHSKKFWKLLSSFSPSYKCHRQWLNIHYNQLRL